MYFFFFFFNFFINFYCQSIISGHTIICAFMTTNLTNLMVTLKICTITVYVFMPWPGKGAARKIAFHLDIIHICAYVTLVTRAQQMFIFVCVEVLWPIQPNGVMSSIFSLPLK